jgi:hypothetical protein
MRGTTSFILIVINKKTMPAPRSPSFSVVGAKWWSRGELHPCPKKDLTIVDKRKICFCFLFSTYQSYLGKKQTDLWRLFHSFSLQMKRRVLELAYAKAKAGVNEGFSFIFCHKVLRAYVASST